MSTSKWAINARSEEVMMADDPPIPSRSGMFDSYSIVKLRSCSSIPSAAQ